MSSQATVLAVLSVICLAQISLALTPASQCDQGVLPTVVLTSPSGDCSSDPCKIKGGDHLKIALNFTCPNYLENMKPKVVAHVLGIDTNYPLPQTDACLGVTNTACPLAEGELVQYAAELDIPGVLPEVALSLTFSLLDTDNDDDIITCMNINLQVVKG